jgi:hypothetical protein
MTARIQSAFNEAPLGCILVFDPGTYVISNTAWLSRSISVLSQSMILDLGANVPTTTFTTSTYAIPSTYPVGGSAYLNRAGREAQTLGVEKFNTAAFVWGTIGANRPQRTFVKGLRTRRTASATGPAGRQHVGIVMLSAFECRLEDTYAENFFTGLLLTNFTSQGTVYNQISKHTSWNCRYPFDLYVVDGGWVNQNTFYDLRSLTSVSAGGVAESITDPGPIETFRVMMHSASSSRPNNNVIINPTLEANADDKIGRKIRLEGSDHIFINARCESDRTNTETLTNGALTGSPPAQWTAGGDFALTGGAAVFTPSTFSGTLTQTSGNFAVAMTANAMYGISFTTSGTLPEGMTVDVTGITDSAKEMCVNTHTTAHGFEFFSGATPGNFVLTVTVPSTHAGAITFDAISLTRIEYQITIGAADGTITASSNWQRNQFIGGDTIPSIYEKRQIEFLQSGSYLWNQGNNFQTGRLTESSGAGSPSSGKRSQHRWTTTSTIQPVWAIGNPSADAGGTPNLSDALMLWPRRASIPWAGNGMWAYCDDSGVIRNWFGLQSGSPWDLRTWAGINIANVLRIRAEGSGDVRLEKVIGTGSILHSVGTGVFKLYSGSSSANDVLVIADSAGDARLIAKAQETVGAQTYLDALLFYDDDATPTLMNVLGLHPSTDLPASSGSRPLLLKWGIIINEQQANADTQIRGQTDANLGYFDASADRLGVGTATPDSKCHVVGKIHGSDELELDGALNHDGTTVGFFGTAPATQPTVTGSRVANPALASLLTALAGLGLIVDSTTV